MKQVLIIGGGVAGMQTALHLQQAGLRPLILERESEPGGKVRNWHRLFPSFTPAEEVVGALTEAVRAAGIEIRTNCMVEQLTPNGVHLAGGEQLTADAIVVATGFSLFDARIKEEYGYGIYDNVITSADLEAMMNRGKVSLKDGSEPQRIAILHCVGSRDEKVCQRHCSKVCCVTGVKQAIELRERFPQADVFNFYMDIRMFGPGYEEMYREAQQRHNIHFVRGRISEVSPTIDHRLQIKAEDTLTGRPLRFSVDMLVLLIGMRANAENEAFARGAALQQADNGFLAPRDLFLHNTESPCEGIFYAGAITAPKSIGEVLNDAATAATKVIDYLNRNK